MKRYSKRNHKILATPKSLWSPFLAAALLTVPLCPAAVITWGSATNVAGTTDVLTTGTVVEAFNLGYKDDGLNTVTVNGVQFTKLVLPAPLTSAFTSTYAQLGGNTTNNVDYDNLLNTVAIGGGSDQVSMTLGGGNLTLGQQYLIQIWFVEERESNSSRVMQYGDGNGNTVNLGNTAGVQLGQYASGTFTANGTNQTLTMDPQDFGNSHLTAYQIRLIPEPSSALLIGLSGGLLLLRRRSL